MGVLLGLNLPLKEALATLTYSEALKEARAVVSEFEALVRRHEQYGDCGDHEFRVNRARYYLIDYIARWIFAGNQPRHDSGTNPLEGAKWTTKP